MKIPDERLFKIWYTPSNSVVDFYYCNFGLAQTSVDKLDSKCFSFIFYIHIYDIY